MIEYYHLDAIGSIRVVTNQAGLEVTHHDFLPFGEEWNPQPPPTNGPLFTGKERDQETGMDYFGARYYRADVGRFTTVDPLMTIKENLVDPQRWNRYAYVRNGPLRFTDPTGETIKVSGSDAERAWLLKAIGSWVGKDAAQYVQINWNKDLNSWEVEITGTGLSQFMGMNSAAYDLGQMVAANGVVVLKASTETLPNNDAAYTFDIGQRGGNSEPVIVLNRSREDAMSVLGTNILNGAGKLYDGRAPANTWGITLAHEMGHAWGNLHDRRTARDQTAREAMTWENTARDERYGIPTVHRVKHQ